MALGLYGMAPFTLTEFLSVDDLQDLVVAFYCYCHR